MPRAGASGGIDVSVYQLDADGYVMQPLDPRLRVIPLAQVNSQLPVITGLNVYQLQPGHRVESPAGAGGAATDQRLRPVADGRAGGLRRIDVSSPGVLVVTTGQGSEVTFGLDNLEQQLRRWRDIYDLGQSMNKAIASLDLAVTNNVPVRWLEASAAPSVSAQDPSNPTHTRKKNV